MAIGRDRQGATDVLVHFQNWVYLLAGEIKVAEESRRIGRNKIDACSRKGPELGVVQARQSIHLGLRPGLRRQSDLLQRRFLVVARKIYCLPIERLSRIDP